MTAAYIMKISEAKQLISKLKRILPFAKIAESASPEG